MIWIGLFGAMALISGVASYIHKRRNSSLPDIEHGIKNASDSQQIYTESALQNAKHNDFNQFGSGS
ncbi:hypothetical protein V1498_07415 [Peribacillus sp. SCS-26]|uniref:hypothetical protein n=1 Tax=Paraperibacillus marinus TaxID=3115295 RepID=UPI0039061E19